MSHGNANVCLGDDIRTILELFDRDNRTPGAAIERDELVDNLVDIRDALDNILNLVGRETDVAVLRVREMANVLNTIIVDSAE